MSSSIKVECEHCFSTFRLKDRRAIGKMVPCPKCSEKFEVREKDEDAFLNDVNGGGYHDHYDHHDDPYGGHEAPQALPRPELRRLKRKKKQPRVVEPETTGFGFPMWLVGGAVGGAIGVGIWTLVVYMTHLEVGYIAWGIGFLVGLGVRMFAGDHDGIVPGLVAAAIAFCAIILAKFLAAVLIVNWFVGQLGGAGVSVETVVIQNIADEIVDERVEAGEDVEWQDPEFDFENGVGLDISASYPPDVWEEATARWEELPLEEQQVRRNVAEEQLDEVQAGLSDVEFSMYGFAFLFSFGFLDLLWLPLAAFTAFQVGANVADN